MVVPIFRKRSAKKKVTPDAAPDAVVSLPPVRSTGWAHGLRAEHEVGEVRVQNVHSSRVGAGTEEQIVGDVRAPKRKGPPNEVALPKKKEKSEEVVVPQEAAHVIPQDHDVDWIEEKTPLGDLGEQLDIAVEVGLDFYAPAAVAEKATEAEEDEENYQEISDIEAIFELGTKEKRVGDFINWESMEHTKDKMKKVGKQHTTAGKYQKLDNLGGRK